MLASRCLPFWGTHTHGRHFGMTAGEGPRCSKITSFNLEEKEPKLNTNQVPYLTTHAGQSALFVFIDCIATLANSL